MQTLYSLGIEKTLRSLPSSLLSGHTSLLTFLTGPAESLFKESYYQLMKTALREDGILCCQGEGAVPGQRLVLDHAKCEAQRGFFLEGHDTGSKFHFSRDAGN